MAGENLNDVRDAVAVVVLLGDGVESARNIVRPSRFRQLDADFLEPGAEHVVRLTLDAGFVGQVTERAGVKGRGEERAEMVRDGALVRRAGGGGRGQGERKEQAE